MAKKAVFGIAKTQSQAVGIADQLKAAGFSSDDVSALFPDTKAVKISLTNNTQKRLRVLRLEQLAGQF